MSFYSILNESDKDKGKAAPKSILKKPPESATSEDATKTTASPPTTAPATVTPQTPEHHKDDRVRRFAQMKDQHRFVLSLSEMVECALSKMRDG